MQLKKFPDELKNKPFYLLRHKNDYGTLNPNSPSDLECWFEDEPEKKCILLH